MCMICVDISAVFGQQHALSLVRNEQIEPYTRNSAEKTNNKIMKSCRTKPDNMIAFNRRLYLDLHMFFFM